MNMMMTLRRLSLLPLLVAAPAFAQEDQEPAKAPQTPAAAPARAAPMTLTPDDYDERIIILVGGVHSYLLAGDEDLPPGTKDGSVLPILLKSGWRVADMFSPAPTAPILVRIIRKKAVPPPTRVPSPLPTQQGHD